MHSSATVRTVAKKMWWRISEIWAYHTGSCTVIWRWNSKLFFDIVIQSIVVCCSFSCVIIIMGLGSLFRPVYTNESDIRKMKQKHKAKHKHHSSAQCVDFPSFSDFWIVNFELFLTIFFKYHCKPVAVFVITLVILGFGNELRITFNIARALVNLIYQVVGWLRWPKVLQMYKKLTLFTASD